LAAEWLPWFKYKDTMEVNQLTNDLGERGSTISNSDSQDQQ